MKFPKPFHSLLPLLLPILLQACAPCDKQSIQLQTNEGESGWNYLLWTTD